MAVFFLLAYASHQLVAFWKYGQWSLTGEAPLPEGWDHGWNLANLLPRLHDYTVGAKASFFMHFPPLILAILCWPAFHSRHSGESRLLLATFAVISPVLMTFSSHGEWCTGPRYYVFLLPLMALPLLTALTVLRPAGQLILGTVVVALTAGGLFIQWEMASRPFFSRQRLTGFAVATRPDRPQTREYLDQATDFTVFRDLNRFMAGASDFEPVNQVLAGFAPEARAVKIAEFRERFKSEFACGFYFKWLCP